ncbi:MULTISPECIES: C40 family peptidase [Streptomyces]|uniref:C40 family peptidase n=1 Tax=Streptomyces TaxID=1883 RepID=UPI001964EFD5|nr:MULTISPECIES: NlpC/P60 family protein [Streptomyces]QRX95698.1 C40 family peptidase [Streptomyces noursei]UJB45458.1 C40 family peptidase [Streptomyces sp. A1-5]
MTRRVQMPHLLARAGTVSALTLITLGGPAPAPGVAAEPSLASVSAKALQIAASKEGSPYKWGAQGPDSFDCSGLTRYSYRRAGRTLPRTAAAQYRHTEHVSRSSRKGGDLVFFHSGSGVYHVGIYAGDDRIWHAPKAGAVVRLERIWSRSVWYGRVP